MKLMRAILLGSAVMCGVSGLASAQTVVPVQWGWGHQDNDDRQAFREGYRQGHWDAEHRYPANYRATGRWREADDVRAFQSGYIRGYREVNGAWRDGGYNGGYDGGYNGGGRPSGIYYLGPARQFGSQDGFNDGVNDRRTGHSNRPAHAGNYKHADRGYDPRFGNKNDYKAAYREAYVQAYQNGYNGGSWQRR